MKDCSKVEETTAGQHTHIFNHMENKPTHENEIKQEEEERKKKTEIRDCMKKHTERRDDDQHERDDDQHESQSININHYPFSSSSSVICGMHF